MQPGQVELQVPTAVKGLTQIQNNERIALRPENGIVSVISRGEEQKEVVLEYDLPLAGGPIGDDQGAPRTLEVQTVWPRRATRQSAKVRPPGASRACRAAGGRGALARPRRGTRERP